MKKTKPASTKAAKDAAPSKASTPKRAAKKAPLEVRGFADVNFKLSVISALMETGLYEEELARVAKTAVAPKPYRPIAEVVAHVAALELPAAELATITSLQPDGGDLAYQVATTTWDGEDDIFDIHSLAGIEALVNLEEFAPIAMITERGVDYTPLLGCPKLTRVDFTYAADTKANEKVRAELEKRGVEIED